MRKTVCAVVRAQSPYCAACLLTHSTSARVSHCWQSSAQLYLYCAVLSVFVYYSALKHCQQPPSQAVHRQALIYPHISSTLNVSSHNQQTAQQPASKVAPKQTFPVEVPTKNLTKICPTACSSCSTWLEVPLLAILYKVTARGCLSSLQPCNDSKRFPCDVKSIYLNMSLSIYQYGNSWQGKIDEIVFNRL